jgi:type II secretory pathway predicted ATPase ExeA
MFTNINANKDELLQLVLVGQPELRDMIRRPDLRQFAQRVSSTFHLSAMDIRTVRAYISHRLKVAGATNELFHMSARDLVYEATGGVPRLVNQLCDLAMVYAFTKDNKNVTRLTVEQVLDDGAFFMSTLVPEGPDTVDKSAVRPQSGNDVDTSVRVLSPHQQRKG